MPNQINLNPEFTPSDGPVEQEVKQTETETPEEQLPPQEKPAEETEPTGEQEAVKPEGEEVVSEDTQVSGKETELQSAIQGLEATKKALLEDINDLRGERRTLREAQVQKVETQLATAKDELKDLHPDDIKTIERIAKARGFVSKEEVKRMYYDNVKNDTLNEFLNKYPQYKPENDPNDVKWRALNSQIATWYKMPENPRQIMAVLERAHKDISPAETSERSVSALKKQVKTASVGAGGATARSSTGQTLTPSQKEDLRRGGWTEEDIKNIEKQK